MCPELLMLLWHHVPVRGVVVINAKIDELILHLVNYFPASSFVLFLEILCVHICTRKLVSIAVILESKREEVWRCKLTYAESS